MKLIPKRAAIPVVLAAFLCAGVLVLPRTAAGAGEEPVVFEVGKKGYWVGGTWRRADAVPYLDRGRVMVPFAFVAEALGVPRENVRWDAGRRAAFILWGRMVTIAAGQNRLDSEGRIIPLDVPPALRNGRLFVPVRALSELFGAEIEWRAQKQQVVVKPRAWSLKHRGSLLEIGFGREGDYSQYAALHLESGYLRLIPSPDAGWGTSVILPPAFWSGGKYYQGARVSTVPHTEGPILVLEVAGAIAGSSFSVQVALEPPGHGEIAATIRGRMPQVPELDQRPGEAFKPVMLSSMHIGPELWDAREAFVDGRRFALPESGWIVPPPFAPARTFGLTGGSSGWKTTAPTVVVELDEPLTVTGWVTPSADPNDDNVGLWAASDSPLSSWSYQVKAGLATTATANR